MAKGVKHYFKNGKEHKGATHKDAKGRVMSGKTHTASSKYLVHMKDLSDKAKKVARHHSAFGIFVSCTFVLFTVFKIMLYTFGV